MWFIYRITNKANTYHYVGITANIEQRLKKHNEGATRSTRPYRPFDRIDILQKADSRADARKLEKYYKPGIGRESLGM